MKNLGNDHEDHIQPVESVQNIPDKKQHQRLNSQASAQSGADKRKVKKG